MTTRNGVVLICCILVVLGGCNRSETEPSATGSAVPRDAISGSPQFSLHGIVSNPISAVQTGRVVVGVVAPSDLGVVVRCDAFIAKSDLSNQSLPSAYRLDGIPPGTYILAGLLIGTANAEAWIGPYGITVTSDGIHTNTSLPTAVLNVAMQGMSAYECP